MPLTQAPVSKSRGHRQRAQALAPYLKRLRGAIAIPDNPTPVIAEITNDPWIRSQVEPVFRGETKEMSGTFGLVTHGCAFLIKCHTDVELLRTTGELSSHTLYTLQAELMLDVAIGSAILREFPPAIEQAVAEGDMAHAKGLSLFGHRVRKELAEAKQVIADSEGRKVDELVDKLTDQPREEQEQAPSAPQQAPQEVEDISERRRRWWRRRKEIAAQVRPPTRTELLVLTLACALVAWATLVKIPQLLDPGPKLIGAGDFPGTLLVQVEARPPSLFVSLDAAAWDAADAAGRESMIDEVASVPLIHDDYRGALIKTSDGRPVAAWARGSGVRMLVQVEQPAPVDTVEKVVVFVP